LELLPAHRRYHPHILQHFSPGVRHVVPRSRRNIRQHLLVKRHIRTAFDMRHSGPVQDYETFFVRQSRVPPDALTWLQPGRSSAHPARLRPAFQQRTIASPAVQRKHHRTMHCTALPHRERNSKTRNRRNHKKSFHAEILLLCHPDHAHGSAKPIHGRVEGPFVPARHCATPQHLTSSPPYDTVPLFGRSSLAFTPPLCTRSNV